MKLLTKAIKAKLLKNHEHHLKAEAELGSDYNPRPAVKFFNPCGAATWLIAEMDNDGMMYGLCDLGLGFPELGYVMLYELAGLKLPFGLGIERDLHFKANKTLAEYATDARDAGRIAA